MAERPRSQLGEVQQTLFIPLLARAQETRSRRPLVRDPKAVEIVAAIEPDRTRFGGFGSWFTVFRTAIYDHWVNGFLAEHPAGTVVELGSGLNTRFERVDNGRVAWFDLDLPDTVALRRRFFADSDRRHTIAASVLDGAWMDVVAETAGPYLFVSEGVLVYLAPDDVRGVLRRLVERFPDARLALDTYPALMMRRQHQMAAGKGLARWQWACDDPRELEELGLRIRETASYRRPPASLRASLPWRYRTLLPLLDRLFGGMLALTLFDADGGA
jgi:O-methyltransferase involved in polyketide biosynthesis